MQQPELLIGQLDVVAVDARRGASGRRSRCRGGGCSRRRPSAAASPRPPRRLTRPAQQRPRARHQLADAERLGQVVVGAAFEADDLVGLSRRAVSIRIGTSRLSRPFRIARHSDRPSRPGSSRRAPSGRSARSRPRFERGACRRRRRRTRSLRAEVQAHELADVRSRPRRPARARAGHAFFTAGHHRVTSVRPMKRRTRRDSSPAPQKQRTTMTKSMTRSESAFGAAILTVGLGAAALALARQQQNQAPAQGQRGGPGGPDGFGGSGRGRGGPGGPGGPLAGLPLPRAEPDRRAARAGEGDSRVAP